MPRFSAISRAVASARKPTSRPMTSLPMKPRVSLKVSVGAPRRPLPVTSKGGMSFAKKPKPTLQLRPTSKTAPKPVSKRITTKDFGKKAPNLGIKRVAVLAKPWGQISSKMPTPATPRPTPAQPWTPAPIAPKATPVVTSSSAWGSQVGVKSGVVQTVAPAPTAPQATPVQSAAWTSTPTVEKSQDWGTRTGVGPMPVPEKPSAPAKKAKRKVYKSITGSPLLAPFKKPGISTDAYKSSHDLVKGSMGDLDGVFDNLSPMAKYGIAALAGFVLWKLFAGSKQHG